MGKKLTSASFVSGMSTGYSGNLGFPMPDNWLFNQIETFCKLVNEKLNYHSIIEFYDPVNRYSVGIEHLMASLNALLHVPLAQEWMIWQREFGQFASWAGDLTTLAADIKYEKRIYLSFTVT